MASKSISSLRKEDCKEKTAKKVVVKDKDDDEEEDCYEINPNEDECYEINPQEDECYEINPNENECYEINPNEDECYEINPDDDECYEIDPTEFTKKLSFKGSDDFALTAEKGPVALRDYSHPRHLCVKFPFNSTSHESYCSKCFCIVCQKPAPCLQWKGPNGHCNVSKK